MIAFITAQRALLRVPHGGDLPGADNPGPSQNARAAVGLAGPGPMAKCERSRTSSSTSQLVHYSTRTRSPRRAARELVA